MKRTFFLCLICSFFGCDTILQILEDPTIFNPATPTGDLVQLFTKQSPISTTFDDAIYEAEMLSDFEPDINEYLPLDLQPKTPSGGYRLKSGLYTMKAKSFCLRGYTHGPSRGDGHLYAPLKGKKADLIQSILEKYGEKPSIPQRNVQVLLWAIIAGADINKLGEKHNQTLHQLLSFEELLQFQGEELLSGIANQQLIKFKQLALEKSPKLQKILNAENKIRSMVEQNKTFQAIEKIAIIPGVAPRTDMIREVSKGRWSHHPSGYYVRFFPNGYHQTRIDVYVPFKDTNTFATQLKEVVFRPATMTAMPANRSSQRIGVSSVPMTPTPDDYLIVFYAFDEDDCAPKSRRNRTLEPARWGHLYIAFAKNGLIEQVKGLSPEDGLFSSGGVDNHTDESHYLGYHRDYLAIKVSKEQYERARSVNKWYYVAPFSDCVSYAADVAASIGLNTPTIDDIVLLPFTYLQALKKKNLATNCSWCDRKNNNFVCN